MDLQRLRYFIGVAESLNFTNAARGLHITVPALSRQIRQLEEELEVQLFWRNRRHVALTAIGHVLLQQARGLLAQATQIEQTLRLAQKGDLGMVKIGIGTGLSIKLSAVLLEHSQRFPFVQVQCEEIVSEQQAPALRNGHIDVGFLRAPAVGGELSSEYVFDERLVALLNRDSWLARKQPSHISVKDLAQEPLLLHDRSSSSQLYDKILDLYRQSGVSPQVVHQGPLLQYPLFVANGKGVAIAPESVYTGTDNKIVVVPLDDPGAQFAVSMVWRKEETSALVLALMESARRVFGTSESKMTSQA
jgi:DNA-binding transcriptional LysR family regulator